MTLTQHEALEALRATPTQTIFAISINGSGSAYVGEGSHGRSYGLRTWRALARMGLVKMEKLRSYRERRHRGRITNYFSEYRISTI